LECGYSAPGVRVVAKQERASRADLFKLTDPPMEWADRAIHVIVGVLFIVVSVWIALYAIREFHDAVGSPAPPNGDAENFLQQAITLINSLLLVLIILEVLGTVRSFLQDGHTSLKPFLVIGIISATRRILAVGAETGVQKTFENETLFRHLMIDLGVNAAVVLALALALWFFARAERDDAAGLDTTEDLHH